MCKYCKLIDGAPGERYNDIPTFGVFKDGSMIIELMLHRYIDDDDYKNRTRAILVEESVRLSDGCVHKVKEKSIPIRYCPFCGEEL